MKTKELSLFAKKDVSLNNRYAIALFLAAQKDNERRAILADLNNILKALENRQILKVISNPFFSSEEIIIAITTSMGVDFQGRLTTPFLKVITQENRWGIFGKIVISYEKLMDQYDGITRVTLSSAANILDDHKEEVEKLLNGVLHRKTKVDYRVNPHILGGILIEYEGNMIDMTTRRFLNDLAVQLKGL